MFKDIFKIGIYFFLFVFTPLHGMEVPFDDEMNSDDTYSNISSDSDQSSSFEDELLSEDAEISLNKMMVEAVNSENLYKIHELALSGANCTLGLLTAIEKTSEIDSKILVLLISYGADVNATTHENTTILEEAIRRNKNNTAKILIDCGADKELFENQLNKNCKLPEIKRSVEYITLGWGGFERKTKNIAKKPKDFNWVKKHKPAKKFFYRWNILPHELKNFIFCLVLKDNKLFKRFKVFKKNESMIIDLMLVNKESLQILSNPKVLSIVLSNAVKLNNQNASNAFVSAAESDKRFAVEAFMLAGLDINQPSSKKNKYQTALNSAIRKINLNLIHFLIEQGADIESKNYAIQLIETVISNEVTMVDEYGIQTTTTPAEYALIPKVHENGDTPLMCAVKAGNLEIVLFLISIGANINAQDWKEETALIKALHYDQDDIAIVLIKNSPPQGAYANKIIDKAVSKKKPKVLALLTNLST